MRTGKSMSDKQLQLVAERFRILGEPLRLRLLQLLQDGERSVGELVERSGAQQANVSKHLQLLRQAGLVARRKEGLQAFYSIGDPSVSALCEVVCNRLDEQLEGELDAVRGRTAG